jgi:catechol 2,3-dioxygenase-like lactoylglutathione lyase family enzyme
MSQHSRNWGSQNAGKVVILMRIGYVVLYVNDAETCRQFWVDRVGMVEKSKKEVGGYSIVQVGFVDQYFSFELVPLEMMADNPYGLDLAAPSIALHTEDLEATRAEFIGRGIEAMEISEHDGVRSFAFCDPEGRWFAVTN